MSESLSMRAARYFGLHTEPRTSVPLSDGKVFIVAERAGRKAFAVYEERNWQSTGTYVLLTERQRRLLLDALQSQEEDA
jgi:hypothetical protein